MTSPAGLSVAERLQRSIAIGVSRIPQRLLRRLVRCHVNADGEEMAPEVALLMSVTEKGEDYSDLDPVAAREVTEAEARVFTDRLPQVAVDPR
jgi:acetyl esterase